MNNPVLIFDFDGTIVDSMKFILKAANELADFYNFKKLDEHEIPKIGDLHIRKLVKKIGLPFYKIPFFLYSLRKVIKKNVNKMELFHGVKDLLLKLKKNGHILALITNNSQEIVEEFLHINEIEVFDYIGTGNIFSILFGKYGLINKFLRKNNISPKNVFYIGEERSDIIDARKCKIKIILACWGRDHCDFKKNHPDFLAKTPHDILKILKE